MLPSSLTQITDHHDDNDIKSSSVLSSSSPSMTTATATIVSPMEAESMISSIQHFPISEIGSSSFLKMYGYQIEKLSLQAHASAAMSTTTTTSTSTSTTASIVGGGGGGEDEYVIDLLLTHDKVVPLVQTLLSIEAWRIFVLGSNEKSQENSRNNNNDDDHNNNNDTNNDNNNDTTTSNDKNKSFIKCIAKQGNSLRIAFILHVETTIVSLLTLLCYRKDHVMDIENKVLLSIVDYCARQMSSLAAPISNNKMIQQQKNPRTVEQMKAKALELELELQQSRNTTSTNTATNTATNTTSEEIIYNLLQTEYQTSIKATSLARYICEHFDSLSISIQSRIINTHDFLMLFIPLIDEPPWTRRRTKSVNNENKNGNDNTNANNDEINEVTVWEKYIDQEWKEIPPCDLLQITQCEAQCWIAIFHLTCSSTNCREQYALNTYRKEQILRLRKFCNEYLMDQIPVLIDVTRYMDELSIMCVPDCNSTNTTRSGTGMNVLMEQVDQIRELILKEGNHDWEQVGMSQIESIYSKITDASDKDLRLIATIYNEENIHFGHGIDTTVSERAPVDLYTTPLELITICICNTNDNGGDKGKEKKDFENMFNLIPSRDDGSTTVQTPNGPFQRMKLTIVQTGDFNYLFSSSQNNGFKLQANLSFKNIVGVTQFIIDLVLPEKSKSTKKMEWIQLGKLEDKLVLQLGFKHNLNDENDSYELEQAFLARPAEE